MTSYEINCSHFWDYIKYFHIFKVFWQQKFFKLTSISSVYIFICTALLAEALMILPHHHSYLYIKVKSRWCFSSSHVPCKCCSENNEKESPYNLDNMGHKKNPLILPRWARQLKMCGLAVKQPSKSLWCLCLFGQNWQFLIVHWLKTRQRQ